MHLASDRPESPARMVAQIAARVVAFAALYLVFIGKVSITEAAAAGAAGLLAAALWAGIEATGRAYAPALGGAVRLAPRLARDVVADCWRLTFAFAAASVGRRTLRGGFVEIPFEPGPGDAADRTRRSLVVAGSCFAPASYAVAIRHDAKRLVRHDLLPKPTPSDPLWPL